MSRRLPEALGGLLAALGAAAVLSVYLFVPLGIAIHQLGPSRTMGEVAAALLIAVAGFVLFVLVMTTRKQMEPSISRANQRSSERIPVSFEVGLGGGERGHALDLSVGGLAVVVDDHRRVEGHPEILSVSGIGEHGERPARVVRSEPIFSNGRRQRLLGLQVLPSPPSEMSDAARIGPRTLIQL
ncbi:MAG: PilZ domain-containing protein [Thermoleophilaceae bacterium]|nr:PilZ domain-containing protein [Thermoleophilaceae bacterium]